MVFASADAMAQGEPTIAYEIRPNDTLIALAVNYMKRPEDYLVVQRLNRIADPRRLTIGGTLIVPEGLLRTEPVLGQIASFRGAVTVGGQPATVGMKVGQGARVETGANAFVTLQLPDGSAISLPSQSRILVATLRRYLLTGSLDRNFRLEAGRSRSSVTPIHDPDSNFRVTTPLSVSAVRGTDFRVALDATGEHAMTEVVGGTVGVAPDAAKDETAVHKAFGIIGSSAGLEGPIALLPGPQLDQIGRTPTGMLVTIKPVEGARSYRVQLASDARFLDIFDEVVSDKPSANFTLDASTTFFVRLTAIAMSGLEGLPATYGAGQRIDPPEAATPAAPAAATPAPASPPAAGTQ